MSIDMSQFYQVFFEEVAEHLASMEALLLETQLDHFDAEQMNAIFRAAHSIKGSSGTFGFEDMARVTHELETLLDLVRKGELQLTAAMVDASLEAGDVLRTMLAFHKGEGEPDRAAEQRVCETLRQLAAGNVAEAVAGRFTYDVFFESDSRRAASPDVIDNLLLELDGLGEVEVVQCPDSGQHGVWRLKVQTSSGQPALAEVLDFVAEPGSVRISMASAPLPGRAVAELAAGAPALGDDAAGAYGFFGPAAAEQSEAYGFFDVELPLPGEPAAPAAYGFFIDPAPDAAAAAAAEPAPAAHAAAPAAKLDAA
ncbi:MAG: Hpt domain-containing protein, partial [Rhodocyclaceae bacterium]|nr:Hpt domain-containing protein [Rhodocyclaceae bacterium]